jgi:uncharacterized protein YkwD
VPASPNTPRTRASRIGLLAVLVMLLAGTWIATAGPVSATTTAQAMSAQILASVNADRRSAGLVALRLDARLVTFSADRSSWMATRGVLSHASWNGQPCSMYNLEHIAWYGCGEAIGYTTTAFGAAAAAALFNMWTASPDHNALIKSTAYNYIGIGVAYRAASHTTYASILFLDGPDRTKPIPSWTLQSQVGGTLHWKWTAYDPALQTHLAGVRNYDVDIRVNGGAWVHLRTNAAAGSCTMPHELPGSTWVLRIRARDNAGNVSGWITSATLVAH